MIWPVVVVAVLLVVAWFAVPAKWGVPFLSTFPMLFLSDGWYHFEGALRWVTAIGTLILCGIWLVIIQPWRQPGLDERELLREQARKLDP